jgi:hypothetical protein
MRDSQFNYGTFSRSKNVTANFRILSSITANASDLGVTYDPVIVGPNLVPSPGGEYLVMVRIDQITCYKFNT